MAVRVIITGGLHDAVPGLNGVIRTAEKTRMVDGAVELSVR